MARQTDRSNNLLLFPQTEAEPPAEVESELAQGPASPDAEDRARALDTSRSWIVEAPAGSGKTGLLIQRYLKLLGDAKLQEPSEVLAITFTRKAAAEMRDRVLAQLHAARSEAENPSEPANAFDRQTRALAAAVLERRSEPGWDLTGYPQRLHIRTIDSVAAEIARSLPILSGSGAGLAPVEDGGRLHAEAARRTFGLLGGEDAGLDRALRTLMLHRDGNLGECESLIASMLPWRDQWGKLIPLRSDQLTDEYLNSVVLPKLERTLGEAICRGLSRLSHGLPTDFVRTLTHLAANMSHIDGHKGEVSPIALCSGRHEPPGERQEDLEHWRALIHLLLTKSGQKPRKRLNSSELGFQIDQTDKLQLEALIARVADDPEICELLCSVEKLPPSKYPLEQWEVAKALFHVLSRALVELQIVFAEAGECDFTELSLLARAALDGDGALEDLATAAGTRLQHLLVDEMQDTSTGQYELIEALTERWDGHGQTVFLVGDPKQSIYLFRQARVERFVQTMLAGKLGDLPLRPLQLTSNFRSQAGLVRDFNETFGAIFPRSAAASEPEQVPYTDAIGVNPPSDAQGMVWHAATLPYLDTPEERRTQELRQRVSSARELRREVERWRAKDRAKGAAVDRNAASGTSPRPTSIAVLVRNRIHLLEIVEAFKSARGSGSPIPFRAVEIEPLGERQEILDLLSLTRALLHPADRTAWLSLLRAPWCGLTLADLHLLAGADDPAAAKQTIPELIERRGELLSLEGMAQLERFWTVMRRAHRSGGEDPLSRWVERTWRALLGHRFADQEELENARRYFELLDELEQAGTAGGVDQAVLKARLQRLYAAPRTHPEAVDLMTIHGAKGLEWDVVFVPSLERVGQVTRGRLLSWLELEGSAAGEHDAGGDAEDERSSRGVLAPIQAKHRVSHQLTQWMRSIDQRREAAERKRLFYVACTRARHELHLFATLAHKKDGALQPAVSSLLASAWPAAEAHFQMAAAAAAAPAQPGAYDQADASESAVILRMAAVAEESTVSHSRPLLRMPHDAAEIAPPALSLPRVTEPVVPAFERPEGSFAARAAGNAIHQFLEHLSRLRAAGDTADALAEEVRGWTPRIARSLRAAGLSPGEVERTSAAVLAALIKTLNDPHGRWLLQPHAEAQMEAATQGLDDSRVLRMDRTFLAGETPGEPGANVRWIVDFKTASPGGRDEAAFLAGERAKYDRQLNAYARTFAGEGLPVRLALYFPVIPRLVWWDPAAQDASSETEQP